MKWIEPAIRVADKKVGILDLELFYSRQQIDQILASGDSRFQDMLSQHLYFDFAFMAGIFPAIAAGCMIAALKTENRAVKKTFYVLAALQIPALLFDILENTWLLNWLHRQQVSDAFCYFRFAVIVKWCLALSAVITAAVFFFFRLLKRKA